MAFSNLQLIRTRF